MIFLKKRISLTRDSKWKKYAAFFISDGAFALISQVATALANFLSTIIILRYSGVEEFGKFSISFMVLMIVRNFEIATFLTPLSTIYPKIAPLSRSPYNLFLIIFLGIFCFFALLSLLALIFVSGYIAGMNWFDGVGLSLIVASIVSILAEFFKRYHFVAANSAIAAFSDILRLIAQVLSLVAIPVIGIGNINTETALYCTAIGASVSATFTACFYGKMTWYWPLIRVMWPRHRNFLLWMTPSIMLDSIQNAIPTFYASSVLGPYSIGLVRAAQQITNVLNLPLNALQQILPSIAAERLKAHGYTSMELMMKKFAIFVTALSVLLGIAVVSLSGIIANAMKVEWSEEFAIILMLFMVLNILLAMRLPVSTLINAMEDPSGNFYSYVVGLAISIFGTALLINQFKEIAIPIVAILNAFGILIFLYFWKKRGSYI